MSLIIWEVPKGGQSSSSPTFVILNSVPVSKCNHLTDCTLSNAICAMRWDNQGATLATEFALSHLFFTLPKLS